MLKLTDRGRQEHFGAAQFDSSDPFVSEQRRKMADKYFDFRQFRHVGKIIRKASGESNSS